MEDKFKQSAYCKYCINPHGRIIFQPPTGRVRIIVEGRINTGADYFAISKMENLLRKWNFSAKILYQIGKISVNFDITNFPSKRCKTFLESFANKIVIKKLSQK